MGQEKEVVVGKSGQLCIQFHQHFTSSFGADILLPKNLKAKK